ncbi:MAG TPA: hypothetical protein VFU82_02010 [Gammaproteobacteria bacterium]|jgi:regulator of replication initiation timing|nr:hypothetical protein [Gammaproteobacteria bacterium]
MTEQMLQKLEEKMMMLLGEVEDLRKMVDRLQQENTSLKQENTGIKFDRENHTRKLEDLLSMLDTMNTPVQPQTAAVGLVAVGQA